MHMNGVIPIVDFIGEPIHGTADFYRDGGHWCIHLSAPNWLLKDLSEDMNAKGGVITEGNRGNGSMLLVAASWSARHPLQEEPQLSEGAENAD